MRRATRKPARRAKAKGPAVRKGPKAWTAAEVTQLRRSYRYKTASELAKILRRSLSSVKAKARALGLRKAKPKRTTTKRKTVTKRKAAPKRRTAARRRRTPRRRATRGRR